MKKTPVRPQIKGGKWNKFRAYSRRLSLDLSTQNFYAEFLLRELLKNFTEIFALS